MRVIVLGGGVSGLSCGVRLLQAGDLADLWALERAAGLLPTGTRPHVLGHQEGSRPGRPSVCLEVERDAGRLVLHDDGHGGAGVTLSWGCAEEGVPLLERARWDAAHVGPIANPSITGSSDGT